MPEKTFKIEVITPERTVLTQEVVSLIVPAMEGQLGIMADHAPLIAELIIGEIWFRCPNGEVIRLATSGGFLEVRENTTRILVDTAERAEEIDVVRAEEARKRAEARLRSREEGVDLARAEAALKRAIVRLKVAKGE